MNMKRETAISVSLAALVAMAAAGLSACKSPMPAPAPAPASSATAKPTPAPAAAKPAPAPAPAPTGVAASYASTEKAYRQDAARHIYNKHGSQVFRGMLPPNIPGVGVVDVSIDARGNVSSISWRRRPSDESFMPVTERLIRSAAPYPAPVKMGKVVYTDIWLWDKSGTFQLDTLTEGQR